jgi:hypothetical protein
MDGGIETSSSQGEVGRRVSVIDSVLNELQQFF